jgi:hypothetical protein
MMYGGNLKLTEEFYVMLPVHHEIFLVSDQLDAPFFFNVFIYFTFQLSTCFEHYALIFRRDKIVLTQLLVTVNPFTPNHHKTRTPIRINSYQKLC